MSITASRSVTRSGRASTRPRTSFLSQKAGPGSCASASISSLYFSSLCCSRGFMSTQGSRYQQAQHPNQGPTLYEGGYPVEHRKTSCSCFQEQIVPCAPLQMASHLVPRWWLPYSVRAFQQTSSRGCHINNPERIPPSSTCCFLHPDILVAGSPYPNYLN